MKQILLVFLSCFFVFSCQEKEEKTEEQGIQITEKLKKATTLHDEIKPRMSELSALKSQLGSLKDSLGETPEITQAKGDLELAQNDMRRWMKQFDMTKQKDDSYMDDQLSQLNNMKELFESSITNAEKIINTHK